MEYSIADISRLTSHQLNTFFPLRASVLLDDHIVGLAIDLTRSNISHISAWRQHGFNPLVTWQYATFLYHLSRLCYLHDENPDIADKIFSLNKMLNSLELFYKTLLPEPFFLSHTVGTVFANASYSSHLIIHHNCTIGRSGLKVPRISNSVVLFPGSSVIGDCQIGSNVVIRPGTHIVNANIPSNSIVSSSGAGLYDIKNLDYLYTNHYFESSV
jgi:serine O-acetyltransferase